MRNSSPFKGLGVALVTPFDNYNIDYQELGKIIDYVINQNVDYIVSLGTTGESMSMTRHERFKVLDFTAERVAGRVPIVAGFGGSDTRATIEHINEYHFNGVDAILSSSPAYNRPTQEGIFRHFEAIGEASPRPIILYNVPTRTASNMEAETVLRLAEASDIFLGIKEASGNIMQACQIIRNAPSGFALFSGDDALTVPLVACGAEGVISVIANALPQAFSDLVRFAMSGDFAAARKIHLQLLPIHHWLYTEGNPAGVKAAMEVLGIIKGREMRLPLVPASDYCAEQLRTTIESALQEVC